MSQDPSRAGDESWEALLRSMMGPEAAEEAIAAMHAAGLDPQAMAQAAGLPEDRAQLSMMLTQMQQVLASGGDGPVNWALAGDVATQAVRQHPDPVITAAQAGEIASALQVADLWLDAATELGPSTGYKRAWSRKDWVDQTMPTWKRLAEPVATSVASALEKVLEEQTQELGEPHPFAALGGGGSMIRQLGGAVFGMQVGQAVGVLAGEAFGTSDTGLPLVEGPDTTLVPTNVTAFAEGLDAPAEEVRLFLATREVAHARLFAQVPWLRSHLLGTVEAYAREITIDTSAMEEAVRSIDPSDPEALREAFSGGVFAMEQSEAQRAALVRLETALALVEGWVEVVAGQAVAPHLPHAVPLREMIRRRRAAGGPAEQTFATLVGLELRPRRLREAATLWTSLGEQRGIAARDALWSHPDLMPTAEELSDPSGFVASRDAAAAADEEVDAALASLLDDAAQDDARDGTARDDSARENTTHDDDGSPRGTSTDAHDTSTDSGDDAAPPSPSSDT